MRVAVQMMQIAHDTDSYICKYKRVGAIDNEIEVADLLLIGVFQIAKAAMLDVADKAQMRIAYTPVTVGSLVG